MSKIEKLKQFTGQARELYKRYEGLIEVYQTGNDISNSVIKNTESAISTGSLQSSNDELNAIRDVATKCNNSLVKLLSRDETGWLEWSGVNAFDKSTYHTSKAKLEKLNNELKSKVELTESLILMAYSLTAMQGWQDRAMYLFVPSLGQIEYIALEETLTKLKAIQTNATIISRKIESAIRNIDKNLISASGMSFQSNLH